MKQRLEQRQDTFVYIYVEKFHTKLEWVTWN